MLAAGGLLDSGCLLDCIGGARGQWYPVLAVKGTDPGRAHAVQVSLRL